MKSWLQSITIEDTGILLVILLLLLAIRIAVMILLNKSFLEERTIRIINWIANVFLFLGIFALFFTAVDNTPLYVNNSPLSLPVSTTLKP